MKLFQLLSVIVLAIVVTNCNGDITNDEIISDNMVLEFRTNYLEEKGKLEILKKGSEKFDRLKSHLNNLEGFKKVNDSIIYPNYIILGNNLKISIDLRKIQLEYVDSSNSINRLSRDINAEEFLDFRYLIKSNNWISDSSKIHGEGEFTSDRYTFCGIVSKEIDYKYKTGNWKFWNHNKKLIAEGKFETDSALALGRGGCDYMMKISKVIPDKWNFYDSNGKQINSTIEQIYKLENFE
ncbi:hypothetical protein [Winogradskyella sp.]|uniref:hypothetical protein n=1 Tax=Winogradskyella sp. TaxID=1883156 RepID=UPI001AFF05BD|nr:hypothetical protein [Winogradskyella sp.]MBO6880999.1 hypothetical protein [Winogradskyella sp.]